MNQPPRNPTASFNSLPPPQGQAPKETSSPQGKKILDRVKDAIRTKHYSERTGETYVNWIIRFLVFHNPNLTRGEVRRHPADMNFPEIEAFVTHLAVKEKLSASSQNQALSAVLFLYREVLKIKINGSTDSIRANKPSRVPVVLTKDEVHRIFKHMQGPSLLMARLMYGSGIRVSECVQLRVKDLDFEYNTHGHKLRFPPSKKAQFVTERGMSARRILSPCGLAFGEDARQGGWGFPFTRLPTKNSRPSSPFVSPLKKQNS